MILSYSGISSSSLSLFSNLLRSTCIRLPSSHHLLSLFPVFSCPFDFYLLCFFQLGYCVRLCLLSTDSFFLLLDFQPLYVPKYTTICLRTSRSQHSMYKWQCKFTIICAIRTDETNDIGSRCWNLQVRMLTIVTRIKARKLSWHKYSGTRLDDREPSAWELTR